MLIRVTWYYKIRLEQNNKKIANVVSQRADKYYKKIYIANEEKWFKYKCLNDQFNWTVTKKSCDVKMKN